MPLSLDGLDGSTPPEKGGEDTERDKEGWGGGPAVTFHLQRLTPPPEETLRLSKRLLIRRRVAGEGLESRYKKRESFWGMLPWRFTLMSQFDRRDKRRWSLPVFFSSKTP